MQPNFSQIIQYRLCSCLNNICSSTSLDLTTACCSWMFHTQMSRGCSCVSSRVPAKRLWAAASQVRLPCHRRAYQEGRSRLLFRWSALFLSSSQLLWSSSTSSHLVVQFLALVSLVLLSLTTLPVGTGCSCGMVGITLCGSSPCSIGLALATCCHHIK